MKKLKLKIILTSLLLISTIHTSQAQAIRYDYKLHFGAGMLVSASTTAYLSLHTDLTTKQIRNISILTSIIVGFGYELFSKVTNIGTAEWNDALYTSMGGITFSYALTIRYN